MPSNPSGTFSRTVTAWSFPTGAEIGGRSSLNLTPSGIDTGTLFGVTAGVFGAGDFARISSPTFLGLSDLSIEFTVRFTGMTATGYVIKVGSPTTSANRALTVRLALVSGNLVWRLERLGAGGTVQVSTSAVAVAQDTDYHVIIILQSGQSNRLIVNGLAVALTHSPTTPVTGVIPILTTDELAIGDPSPTNENTFLGTLGRLVVYPYVMTDTQIATASIATLDQRQLISIGAATAIGAANHGPVAVPFYSPSIEANGTNFIDLNTPGRGFDADGNALTAIDAGGSGGQGTVTITATNMLRYTPTGGTGGILPHTVPQRIRDPGNLVGNSIVNVPVTNPSGGDFFDLVGEPWIPNANRNITAALGNLTALADGRIYRLPAGTFLVNTVVAEPGRVGTTSTLQTNVRLSGQQRTDGLPGGLTTLMMPDNSYTAIGGIDNRGDDQVFRIIINLHGITGVRLYDMTLDGNYTNQLIQNNNQGDPFQSYRGPFGGENGGWHCVRLAAGANNFRMERVRCIKGGTDGLKIRQSNNVTCIDCDFFENRRCGASPNEGDGGTFTRCTFNRSGRLPPRIIDGVRYNTFQAPCSGFGIEPNTGSEDVTNYTLSNCEFNNNGSQGFYAFTGNDPDNPGTTIGPIQISDSEAMDNSQILAFNESFQWKIGLDSFLVDCSMIRCNANTFVQIGAIPETARERIDNFVMDDCVMSGSAEIRFRGCDGGSTATVRNTETNGPIENDAARNSAGFSLTTDNNR